MEIGHKDRRGIFVAEKDRDDLLSKLGEKLKESNDGFRQILSDFVGFFEQIFEMNLKESVEKML